MLYIRNIIRWVGIGVRFLFFSKVEGGGDENEECVSEFYCEVWFVFY